MWDKIIGQDRVKETLKSIFESGKVSHAYLFYGQEGSGKDAAAIEFAKLLNCTNKKGSEACDNCQNCINIASLKSELINFICALPSSKSGENDNNPLENLSQSDYDEYLEQLNFKSIDPYYKIKLSNANNIKISSIRELISKIYLSGNKNFKKVYLISEADKMRQESANALLKILEEPPNNSIIILTTSRMNSLLQTITGRCHKIFFEPLPYEQIYNKVKKANKNIDINEASLKLAARFSDGSYSKTIDLLEKGIDDIREKALDFMVAILKNDYLNQVLLIKEFTLKTDKEKLKNLFFFLNLWFRDLLYIKHSDNDISTNKLINFDKLDRLKKFIKNYPDIDFYNIIIELESSERMIEQNISTQLIITNLAFKIKQLV